MHTVLDWADFESRISVHLECVAIAAATGRGLLAVISQ
jgi:hypothetical protein